MALTDRVLGRSVHPSTNRVFKFLPRNPPRRGEHVVVDGVRCRVIWCRVRWDGPMWEIKSLRVKADPL